MLFRFNCIIKTVIEHGLALVNLSDAQLKRLEVIQNEGMRTILGCTKDISAAAMRYTLDLPTKGQDTNLPKSEHI